jgi:PAS domain S-box-containing protein
MPLTTFEGDPHLGSAELPLHLRRAVDESVRLLGASGAMLYLLDESGDVLRWAYDAGIRDADELAWVRSLHFPVGVGVFGRAVSEQRPQSTSEYRGDAGFVHSPLLDRFVEEMEVRSMIAAPLIGSAGAIGALGAFSRTTDAFDAASSALLAALATHAALAIDNARLIDELSASRAAEATRAQSERSLRDIAARITAMRDPAEVAQQVVDESQRLLAADAALLALVDEGEIHSAVVAGDLTPEARRVMTGGAFHVRGSLLASAVTASGPVTVEDYLTEVVGREAGHNTELARLLDLRGLAVAPLHAQDRVVGLLGVWSHAPRAFADDELALLQGLADVAAIAVDNARLTHDLAASETRYRFLIERSPDLVWEVDRNEHLVFLNDRVESLLGYRPDELVGTSALDLVHEDSLDSVRSQWAASWNAPGVERTYRFHLRHRDGHAVPVELRSVGVRVDGQLVGFHGSLRDETERDRLERDLRESEARYRFLTEHSPDIITAVDASGVLTYVSGRALQLTGWTPDEVVGRRFSELIHPDTLGVMRASWRARRANPAIEQQYRLSLLHRNGHAVPVEVRSVGIVVDGEFRGSQASIRDMSDRDRLERELRRQEAEIAASQERAKLAQELHDSVTQALFSMTLTTRSAEMLLERDPACAGEKLTELRELATDALAEMRGLIFELRPGSLDRDGLVTALRKHAAAVQGRTGISVVVEATDVDRVAPDVEETLYRIAQEALHNVVKHARASEARIVLDHDGTVLRMSITDDGVGFDPSSVPSGHLGLEGMRTRAERIGATVDVESRSGGGTRIEVLIPVVTDEEVSADLATHEATDRPTGR